MKTLIARAVAKSAHSRRRLGLAALTACLAAASTGAFASAQVSGTAQSVSVDAQNSSVKEVLSALGRTFKLRFQSTANLDRPISGTYQGSLQRVVARLLEGYNFIIQTDHGNLQITVLGTQPQGVPNSAVASSGQVSPGPQSTTGTPPGQSSQTPQIAAQAKSVAKPASAETSPSASSPPQLVFKVAEGNAPMPTPVPSNTKGPVPGPATSQMPMPKGSSAMPAMAPPAGANTAILPMPTTVKPFPGLNGQQPAPGNPSTANGSPSVAPPMPTPTSLGASLPNAVPPTPAGSPTTQRP